MCKRAFKLARFVLAKRMSNFKTRLNNKLRAYEIMKISFELKNIRFLRKVFLENNRTLNMDIGNSEFTTQMCFI